MLYFIYFTFFIETMHLHHSHNHITTIFPVSIFLRNMGKPGIWRCNLENLEKGAYFCKYLENLQKLMENLENILSNWILFNHFRHVNFKIFSNHGGLFKLIFSYFRYVNFKIFSNHGGKFKCIFSQ